MDTYKAVAKDDLVRRLEEARQRTRWLLRTGSDEDLSRQHDPIMSPLIWDYGHIGNYEELWLLEKAFGKCLSNLGLDDIYATSLHPREERSSLNLGAAGWNLRLARGPRPAPAVGALRIRHDA
jgi:gamma-glutamyl hercynylcysteine S-oxide synthase